MQIIELKQSSANGRFKVKTRACISKTYTCTFLFTSKISNAYCPFYIGKDMLLFCQNLMQLILG